MTERDQALEDAINRAFFNFAGLAAARRKATGRDRQELAPQVEQAWREVEGLIKQRSPRAVAELEQSRGLAPLDLAGPL